MTQTLLLAAAVITACVIFSKISGKLGIPALLAFIILGMFFGSDGIVKIEFDNYEFAEKICSTALIFIMFYGGFGTNWQQAKPIAARAVLLSSLGTVATAGLVGVFCRYVLNIAALESFLIGAVISSTDAASVFSILRSKRLNLRDNTASLLELESGSNDPFSYMLTVIALALMNGEVSGGSFVYMLFSQLVFAVLFGALTAMFTMIFLKKVKPSASGFDAIFIVSAALAAYALPTALGGNGYLSVYITGIILGNRRINNKQALVHFFDGATALMQMLLFFLLGLLAFPSQLPSVALTSLCIAVFLTFVARPIAVFVLLSPFKSSLRQQLLVAWSGMRGAASIVFAIMAVINPAVTDNDIFHIVFFIVLFSILLQGSLIPLAARKTGMTDPLADVMKTFNDYIDKVPVQFIEFEISPSSPWSGKSVGEIVLPPDCILVLLMRGDEKTVPNGKTVLETGDKLILSGRAAGEIEGVNLYEKQVGMDDEWSDKAVCDIPAGEKLIIMIKRSDDIIIPRGDTVLRERDILVINDAGN
ncbi:MAG: potassium/proton antiporter [Clostridiales bacterium]|nr:potassium/proton antiporter [Clostridiales bacterium]